jgi:hypothetical protein
MYRDDVRVIELSGNSRLLDELHRRHRVLGELGSEDLHRAPPEQRPVVDPVDAAHSTAPDLGLGVHAIGKLGERR